jgi:hypothetical protein
VCLECFKFRADCKCGRQTPTSRKPRGVDVCCCEICAAPHSSSGAVKSCTCAKPVWPCESHVAHAQLRTNGEMYSLFCLLHPELASIVSKTMLMSFKPYYVAEPNKRTCVCSYHSEMKMAVEDARSSLSSLHDNCGKEGGCACDFCKDGACKKLEVFKSHHELDKTRLCLDDEGVPAEKDACVKLLCDDCGIMAAKVVSCEKSPNGVGVTVDEDMYVIAVKPNSPAALAAVQVGWRVVAAQQVEGENETEMTRVSCKTALAWQTGRHRGDPQGAFAKVRFQTLEKKPSWATCPLMSTEMEVSLL